MCPFTQSDGHDCPGLIEELVPGVTAMVEDVGVGAEDAVREPVVADELPDVLDRIEFRRYRWQRPEGDVGGNVELVRALPGGPIQELDGVRAGRDGTRDLRQVQRHGRYSADRQDNPCASAQCRSDGSDNVS